VSLQRRLLVYLLLCAPIVWAAALLVSADRARDEVNELFDTEIIRLALQVQAVVSREARSGAQTPAGPLPAPASSGEADLRDFALAVWDAEGQLLFVDREGAKLPRRPNASGFVELPVDGQVWRVYYLQSARAESLVAAGQRVHEREELVWSLMASQLLPWLLVLPLLLLAMTWAVRRALAPLHSLASELRGRAADALQPVPTDHAPAELQPLLAAMNGLFARTEATLTRERRFTADAAHELRTPLAVLRAQWDVVRSATDGPERRHAEARLSAGLERMDRLVTQMLAMSRVEAADRLWHTAAVQWQPMVERVMSDVLPLAERRRIELGCDWPADGVPAFPLQGDGDLLAILLRNLLDNAVRYAPEGSAVTLRFDSAGLKVENAGPPLSPEAVARMGERFHRIEGASESGSGLGVSIAKRIAELHGLALRYGVRPDGSGVVVELGPA
jgi:two-component system sensor histidine kinase QseC